MLARIACALLLCANLAAQQPSTVPSQSPSPPPEASRRTTAPPAAQGFRIAGVIVNSLTGQPVPSARVAIARVTQGSPRDINQAITTGADGRFSFTGLTRGKYSLMAMARGSSLQFFEHHDPYATAVAVGPDLDSSNLVFHLEPDASIEGMVTDDNNEPVQYAMVRLFQRSTEEGEQKTNPENQTQTDDQGHYHIGHLEPGTYYLAVSARPWYAQNARPMRLGGQDADPRSTQDAAALDLTYPLTFYAGVTDSADATPLQLNPGERATADVALHATPSLHLRIHTGAAESATLGRMVFPRVYQRIFEGYLDSASNAPDSWVSPGVVEVSGLAPGHYVIEVPSSNSVNAAMGPGERSTRGWYRDLDLAGDTDITVSDSPGFSTVSGTILFPASGGVPSQTAFTLTNPDTGETFRSDIDAHGNFDFRSDNVRPGRYLVGLESPNGYTLEKLAATGGAKVSGRTIEITNASNVRISAIGIHGASRVTGTAMRDGEPFSGAMIVLVPQDASNNRPLFRRDQSDSDGTFTLPNVVPGQYTVIAIANGWDLEWANPTVLQPYLKNGATVQVPAGEKLDVKVQVQ
jgi:5-hydroxyisourate hydrolase-like protein (transthyretin family)